MTRPYRDCPALDCDHGYVWDDVPEGYAKEGQPCRVPCPECDGSQIVAVERREDFETRARIDAAFEAIREQYDALDRERQERIARLEAENARLRAVFAECADTITTLLNVRQSSIETVQ